MRFLDRSPILEQPSEVFFLNERIRLHGNQIILWVTLSAKQETRQSPSAIPFPAILDTGFTHSFSIREQHLRSWAGLRREQLTSLRKIRDRNETVLLHAANIWVHPSVRRSREVLENQAPYTLNAGKGIYFGDFPRLPILGLRALVENRLTLKIDGARREATLRTKANWLWPFL